MLSLYHQDHSLSLPRDFPHRFPQQSSNNPGTNPPSGDAPFRHSQHPGTTGECFTTASKASRKECNHPYWRAGRILLSLLVWCHFQDGTWPLEILNYIRGAAKIKWQQQQTVKKGFRGLCKAPPLTARARDAELCPHPCWESSERSIWPKIPTVSFSPCTF